MGISIIQIDESVERKLKKFEKRYKIKSGKFISEAIINYISQFEETAELLSSPHIRKLIKKGKEEVRRKVKGYRLDELDG